MAGYQRKTALPPADVFARAEEFLPEFVGLSPSKKTAHGATYTGAEAPDQPYGVIGCARRGSTTRCRSS